MRIITLQDVQKQRSQTPLTSLPFSCVCPEYCFLSQTTPQLNEQEHFVNIVKISELAGKKMASKRAKLRKFTQDYPNFSALQLTNDNFATAYEVEKDYQSLPQDATLLSYRRCCFRSFVDLNLQGTLITVNDAPLAYAIAATVGNYGIYLLAMHSLPQITGLTSTLLSELAKQLLATNPKLQWLNFGVSLPTQEAEQALSYQPEITQSYHQYTKQI